MSPSQQRLCSEPALRAAQRAKQFVLTFSCWSPWNSGFARLVSDASSLKCGNFYRGVIPSVLTTLALTGSHPYSRTAILCTYLFYLLALFTPYLFMIEVLLFALSLLKPV